MTLFLRANLPGAQIAAAVAALRRLDPNLAVSRIQTFDDAIAESLAYHIRETSVGEESPRGERGFRIDR